MKPESTKETTTKIDNDFYAKQTNAPPTIIELKSPDYFSKKDIEYFRNKMHQALKPKVHEPENCPMCNEGKWKLDGPILSMGYGSFEWHLKALFKSNGQRLNREMINVMWNRYQEIVDSLRRNSKIANRPQPGFVKVTMDVSA
jgi:hypothetical protein